MAMGFRAQGTSASSPVRSGNHFQVRKDGVRCVVSLHGLSRGLRSRPLAGSAHADVVTDWNQIMSRMIFSPPATSNLVTSRVAAIMHAAVFDAVNGIERRYSPIHVNPAAPRGASRRAAAIQAAYATLVVLYPSQKDALDAQRQASLEGITDDGDFERQQVDPAGNRLGADGRRRHHRLARHRRIHTRAATFPGRD